MLLFLMQVLGIVDELGHLLGSLLVGALVLGGVVRVWPLNQREHYVDSWNACREYVKSENFLHEVYSTVTPVYSAVVTLWDLSEWLI